MTKYGMTSASGDSSSAPHVSPIQPSISDKHPSPSQTINSKYLQWSQSVMMFICGKGKDDLLSTATRCPDKDDKSFKSWRLENNMVMSWLINSMTTEIGENFLLYPTAKDIWEAAKDTYSCKENAAELLEIESRFSELKQGNGTVTQYFITLTRHWQQLDLFETHAWKCPNDGTNYRAIIEKKHIFQFLLGLNTPFDELKGHVLASKPLLTLHEAFSEICHEKSRRKLMLGTPTTAPAIGRFGPSLTSRTTASGTGQCRLLWFSCWWCFTIFTPPTVCDMGDLGVPSRNQIIPWIHVGRSIASLRIGSLPVISTISTATAF